MRGPGRPDIVNAGPGRADIENSLCREQSCGRDQLPPESCSTGRRQDQSPCRRRASGGER
ncbi:unnamed protein product, partial [Staurois parvus]